MPALRTCSHRVYSHAGGGGGRQEGGEDERNGVTTTTNRREEKAREEQKAKLEAEKKKLEREEDTGKKLPVKPPTTTKKVSRDDSSSFQTCFELVKFDLRLRGKLRRSKRWMVAVLLLSRSHHNRQSLLANRKSSQSRFSGPLPLRKKPPPCHLRNLYPSPLPRQIPANPKSPQLQKGKGKAIYDDEHQPSQIVKSDMAARTR